MQTATKVWVTVSKAPTSGNTATALTRELRTAFSLYGAPMELATDGGPQFASHTTQQFLRNWGVKWRISSAYNPQSNGRAELAVKTAKRLIRENSSPSGDLNTDSTARALLQYRNTPLSGSRSITCSAAVWSTTPWPLTFFHWCSQNQTRMDPTGWRPRVRTCTTTLTLYGDIQPAHQTTSGS